MAKPIDFDKFCWFVLINYDLFIPKNWIWPLLSKKTTFYCTLNLTHFSKFAAVSMPLCDRTIRVGLDLTCSSSRGFNFEDYSFFYFLNLTSRSRVSPIQRFTTQQISQMSPIFYQSLMELIRLLEVRLRRYKKWKSSKFYPRDDEQVKSSPTLKVWSHKGVKIR